MNEKVKQILASIVDTFKSGKIPDAVALASFPVPDIRVAIKEFEAKCMKCGNLFELGSS